MNLPVVRLEPASLQSRSNVLSTEPLRSAFGLNESAHEIWVLTALASNEGLGESAQRLHFSNTECMDVYKDSDQN